MNRHFDPNADVKLGLPADKPVLDSNEPPFERGKEALA